MKERDLLEFYARASVVPIGVSLVTNQREQPNGEVTPTPLNPNSLHPYTLTPYTLTP